MTSTFSARKTTVTIALRQTEPVETCRDRRKRLHAKEFAGHKFVLMFILLKFNFWSSRTFCHGKTGSCFEAETDSAGKSLVSLVWLHRHFWIGAQILMGRRFAFPAKHWAVGAPAQCRPPSLQGPALCLAPTEQEHCRLQAGCRQLLPSTQRLLSTFGIKAFQRMLRKKIRDSACLGDVLQRAWIGRRGGQLCGSAHSVPASSFCVRNHLQQNPIWKPKQCACCPKRKSPPRCWSCTCSSVTDLCTESITHQLLELGSRGDGNH